MRNLIIIGAGGMGRTIYDMALENNGYLKDFQIKGFIELFFSYSMVILSLSSLI
jgi:molybdopterin biosynthesis enzyme MoaB